MIYALILSTALVGQTGSTVEVPDHVALIEEMLAHIYVVHGSEAMEKARGHFESQSPSQVRVIHRVFKQKQAEYNQRVQAHQRAQQQSVMNQAILNKQRAESYRDHLKREFQITQQQKAAELAVLRAGVNMARGFYSPYGGYRGYTPRGYRGYRGQTWGRHTRQYNQWQAWSRSRK